MSNSPNVSLILEYFQRVDAGRPDVLDLFTDDIEFYFPKFGFGAGKGEFIEFASGFVKTMSVTHDIESLRFLEAGDHVICEGTSHGTDASGGSWRGGETPASRFCSIYRIRDGLIANMRIYLDPDYTSQDSERFLWGMGGRRW